MKATLPLLAVLAACALPACTGSLFDSSAPPARIYVLAPAPASSGSMMPAPVDLLISEPAAAPGLATERIAVLHPDRHLEYYAGARWGSASSAVLQSLVVASLRNQASFRSVTAAPSGTAATHVVDIELRDFQAEYSAPESPPTIRVSVVANVLRLADRRLLAVIPASATVAARENRVAEVVAAFEAAAQQVAVSLGRDTATTLAAESGGSER